MTDNIFQRSQLAYGQAVGTTPTSATFISTRDPNANDVDYPIGKFWQNTADESLWYLNSFSSANAILQANWITIESSLQTISDTANTPVHASSGLAVPPDNIQLIGGTGITIVSDPSTNSLTISAGSIVPDEFITDSGTAVPAAGIINDLGSGSITTTGSGNTITTQLTGLTNHALLIGAGTTTITKLSPSGTAGIPLISQGVSLDPAYGTALVVGGGTGSTSFNINGVVISNTTTTGALSALTLTDGQIVIGSTIGAPLAATLTPGTGISITNGHNSITIAVNGSIVAETITGNTGGALSPTAGNWNIFGAAVVAGTTPVATSGTGSTLTTNVQISQAIASTDATKVGLAAFNSAQFTVDANGFVSASGTGILDTLTGNSGGAVSPTAGNIDTVGTGSITIVGNPGTSTLTTELTGLNNHAVLVGAGTATITNVGPTATAGQVLQSAGSSADPAFSTATYPSTTTINQILYSSANNVVDGLATANDGVLTTGATGTPVITALAADGQLIIGSGSGAPAAATLTAGTNITIVNAANSITISADTAAQSVHYTNVNAAASPYTVLAADFYISVDSSGGAVTLNFPNAPTANRIWVVKDRTGSAATHNITITTPGGTVTFDGATSFVMNTNYESINLLANAVPGYEIY